MAKRPDFWKDENTEWFNSFKTKIKAQRAADQLMGSGYQARVRHDPKLTGWHGSEWHKEYPYAVWYRKGVARAKRRAPRRKK